MGHVLEIAVGIRIVQRAVLAKRLPIVAALDAMEHVHAAVIRAVEQIAMLVEVESPRIAAAFAEKLKLVRDRMIAPDTLLELDTADVGRNGAPLAAIQPAVRPPGQRVGHR